MTKGLATGCIPHPTQEHIAKLEGEFKEADDPMPRDPGD